MLIASSREEELTFVKLADFGVSLLTGEGSGPIALLARKPSSASLRGGMGPSSMSMPSPPSDPGVQPGEGSGELIEEPSTRDMYTASDEDGEADTDSIMRYDESDFGTASLAMAELKSGGQGGVITATPPPIPVVTINPAAGPRSNPVVTINPAAGPPSNPVVTINPAAGPPSNPVVTINPAAHPGAVRPSSSRPPPMPRTLEMDAARIPEFAVTATPSGFDAAEIKLRPSQASVSAMLAAVQEDSMVGAGQLTQADALIGTPMYMAPELSNTGSHRAEPLSDIFSIGVIAFELLTGRMPFAVPPVISHANDEPIYITRLSQVRPDLDPRLIALVESCLALNPSSRPGASELTRRLIELGAPAPRF